MIERIVMVVVTACLSSAFTLGLAWWIWERRLRKRLEDEIERLAEVLGETVRERVRQGALDAAADLPSMEVIGGVSRTVADTAVDLLRGGLDTILGPSTDPEE